MMRSTRNHIVANIMKDGNVTEHAWRDNTLLDTSWRKSKKSIFPDVDEHRLTEIAERRWMNISNALSLKPVIVEDDIRDDFFGGSGCHITWKIEHEKCDDHGLKKYLSEAQDEYRECETRHCVPSTCKDTCMEWWHWVCVVSYSRNIHWYDALKSASWWRYLSPLRVDVERSCE